MLAFTRGHGLVRLFFNLGQFALTGCIATVVLHAIAPAPQAIGPSVWGATFVAVFAASVMASVLVFCAIGLSEGGIPSRRLAGMLGADLVVALVNTSVALSGATVVAHDLRAGWLLIPPAVILLVAYRAYVSERAKHQSLEFLYGVTRSLSRGRDLERELQDLLRETRASFRVRTAEIMLLSGGDGGLRTSLALDGREEAMVETAAVPRARCGTPSTPCWWIATTAIPTWRLPGGRGIAQALVAPVRGETRLAGVMVLGDRIGATPSFTDEDVRLFEALATHAGLSLRAATGSSARRRATR